MTSNKNFAKFINIDGKYRFYNDESDLIKIYQEEITQLTNNWNKLEEWVKKQRDYYDRNDEYSNFRAYADELDDVLDKMEEIKRGKDEK